MLGDYGPVTMLVLLIGILAYTGWINKAFAVDNNIGGELESN